MSEIRKRHPRRSDEEWLALIQECRTSGIADRTWCQNNHISTSKFYYHIRRLRAKACSIPDNPRVQSRPVHHEIVKLDFSGSVPNVRTDGSIVSGEFQTDPVLSEQIPVNGAISREIHTEPAIHISFGRIGVDISNSADRSTILNTLSVLQSLC